MSDDRRYGSDALPPAVAAPGDAVQAAPCELYDSLAYVYDGTLEGLLTAIFCAYESHEDPDDVLPQGCIAPRLGQRVALIGTDAAKAQRVADGLRRRCGRRAFDAVRKASLSEEPDAGTAAYRFVRYAIDEQKRRDCPHCRKRATCPAVDGTGRCPRLAGRAISDITHPAVAPMHRILRSMRNECEHLRQFARFEHLRDPDTGAEIWYARCSPKSSCVPLVMDHFVERFSVQPFILFDEAHAIAGVYDGGDWYLVRTDEVPLLDLPGPAAEEGLMQDAWRRFYRAVSVEARYHPELRRQFMPKRFWKDLTELQPLASRALGPRQQNEGMKLSSAASPS